MTRPDAHGRPQLVGLITTKTWYEAARAIYRHARLYPTLSWVDADGGVWCRRQLKNAKMPPTEQVLGLYGTDISLNEVEDDVLHYLQQLTKKAKTA